MAGPAVDVNRMKRTRGYSGDCYDITILMAETADHEEPDGGRRYTKMFGACGRWRRGWIRWGNAALWFVDVEFTHASAQGAAVEPQDFGRTVFTADLPLSQFKNPKNMIFFNRCQSFGV